MNILSSVNLNGILKTFELKNIRLIVQILLRNLYFYIAADCSFYYTTI